MANVILYVHDLRSSGVVRNAIAYARRLAEDHPTTLVAGYGAGLFADAVRGEAFAVVTLGERPSRAARLTAAVRLRRWLKTEPPGILLSVGNMGHPTSFWATRGLTGIARVYRISNTISRGGGARSRLRHLWMRILIRDAARVALVGSAFRRETLFAEALANGHAVEIPNGIDPATAIEQATAPSPHPWLDEPVPTVLAIGRLRPQKNFDVLIRAVALVRKASRLRLVILGAGTTAEQERLRQLAEDAGLGEDFLLAGETDNVFAWLARATVFALPSRWEGSSMALLEALAVGTPIVASRQAGDASHVLEDGRYGLLVDCDDAIGLAAGIERQVFGDVVRPEDRADRYAISLEPYARLIAEIVGPGR
jgi:glycosyltransferase involved in cell wall biosynthesis